MAARETQEHFNFYAQLRAAAGEVSDKQLSGKSDGLGSFAAGVDSEETAEKLREGRYQSGLFEKLFSEHEIVLLDVKRKVRVSSVRKESGVFDDEVVLWIKDANISREQFLEVLVKTIKKWALTALQEEFELKLAQMGPFRYPYRKFFLTSAKTRWGSCSSRGHVRIHWNTVFVTKSERDYLYTHEAAHLTEMNHSPRFWQLVEVHCPGYKRARTILHSRTLGFL